MKFFCRLLALFLLPFMFVTTASGIQNSGKLARVLILYDSGSDKRQPALAEARYIENLVGHFSAHSKVMPVSEYKSGLISSYDVIFYQTYEKSYSVPKDFIEDIFSTKKTVCWLNRQLDTIDQTRLSVKFGFHALGYREETGFTNVLYKNIVYPKGDANLMMTAIDNPALAKVVAYAENRMQEKIPYIIQSANFWYVADSPFSYCNEQDRYIVFADLLHDIIGQDHSITHKALVRIEDINPMSDPGALLKIMRYLQSEKISFAVSLVPVYVDPVEKVEIHLSDKPAMLKVLQQIPSFGGAIVMHGYTHQYHGLTTDDYEFWDDIEDKPVRNDSVEYARNRIEKGFKELVQNGLYPFAWETPHYCASSNTFIAVHKVFSHAFERRNVMQYLGSDQFFPYPVTDMYGIKIIPEDLGYIPLDKQDETQLLYAAHLELGVRDGYASFFFHPFVSISHLKNIVKELRKMGYKFEDIRSFQPSVVVHDKAVVTANGSVNIDSRDKFVSIEEFNDIGVSMKKRVVPNPNGHHHEDVVCPPKHYIVFKTMDELEPNMAQKIWSFAKRDLNPLHHKDLDIKNNATDIKLYETAILVPDRQPADLSENNNLQSFKFVLNVAGIRFTEIPLSQVAGKDLSSFEVIILPHASALEINNSALKSVRSAVNAGSRIIFDGVSRVIDEFGIEMQEKTVRVKTARDTEHMDIPLYWNNPAFVQPLFNSVEKNYTVLAEDDDSNLPLVVAGDVGEGGFIFFSTLFDPDSTKGYSRFPFFIEMLERTTGFGLLAERKRVEIYFDPGMRQSISIEKLVKLWRANGIKRIYAAGWHIYEKYTYDYARLVRVCHENGILVYCWLEPPLVNKRFWDKYPAWREKTAISKDADFSWRYLMNLADPACRARAFSEIEGIITKYDWDGVNVAELYFESASGPTRPDQFTPMNQNVRTGFSKLVGSDPILLFDKASPHYWVRDPVLWKKFVQYRTDLCNNLKAAYIDMLQRVRTKKPDFEIMLTFMDTTTHPILADNLAEDLPATLDLARKNDLTLQVEDPMMMWNGKPERYAGLGNFYRASVLADEELVLDCNVLDNHPRGEGGMPAVKPTGQEIGQIAYNIDLTKARPAFYSEDSINEFDFPLIAAVLARETVISAQGEEKWKVESPYTTWIGVGKKGLIPYLDNDVWFAGDREHVIVPAGAHSLSFKPARKYFSTEGLKAKMLSISAELKWASFQNGSMEFAYKEDKGPCYVIFSKKPLKILVDNKKVSLSTLPRDSSWSVRFPGGDHVVRVIFGGNMEGIVETSGIVLLSLMIVFGSVSSLLFLALFLAIRIKRMFKL